MPLTEEQIRLVKATAPVLKELGVTITKHFYHNMFTDHPELRNIFNMAHQRSGVQPQALANSVFAYAANIDNLGALAGAVSRIGHKHASLIVEPAQYAIVGSELLRAIKEVLGDAIDDATVAAWGAAYTQLADILIDFERNLYYEAASVEGGWTGWRSFKVVEKKPETDEITSFILKPTDNGAVPVFKAGQFISVKLFVPALGYFQPRQYSLSCPPNGDCFRITVKKEAEGDCPHGVISSMLHETVNAGDCIDLSPPFGDFCLDITAQTPVVMLSGGVGMTPMLSMLGDLLTKTSRKVVFLHATRTPETQAMKEYLTTTTTQNADRLYSAVWYGANAPESTGSEPVAVHAGRINVESVKDHAILPDADYYVCGPVPFMNDMSKQLEALGVAADKIHSEVFGSDAR